MSTSREDFYKKSYPAVKFRGDPVYPSNDSASSYYGRPSAKSVPAFYKYFSSQLLRLHSAEDTMDSWQDGIYTWVLLDTNDFFAIRTLTGQETGTLHENILKYIVHEYGDEFPEPKEQFVASGELYLKRDANSGYRRIFFNFESGTFFKLVLNGKTEKQQVALQKKLVSRVESLLETFCPAGCIIQPLLGTSFFSLFRIYTPPSIVSNISSFLPRIPSKAAEPSTSFNNDEKPGTLYVSNVVNENHHKTKRHKIKGNNKGNNKGTNKKPGTGLFIPKKKANPTKSQKRNSKQGTKKKSLSMKKK